MKNLALNGAIIFTYTNNAFKAFLLMALILGSFYAFGPAGAEKAYAAASTYFVDLTGKGCGNNCADFNNFLAKNGISVTTTSNTNSNSTNPNGLNATATTGGNSTSGNGYNNGNNRNGYNVPTYPYQIYTNFPSTDAYYQKTATIGSNTGPYPYNIYNYFENPGPKYDPYTANNGQYVDKYYVYYNGKSAADQLAKYQSSYTPSYNYGSGYNGYGTNYATGGGFIMTSGR